MSTRKNIDKLYLSKFEGAEVAPPKDAWQNIVSRLPEEKKKKNLIPFWFRYAGAAAILLLLVGLGLEFFSPNSRSQFVNTPVTRQDVHNEIRLSTSDFTEAMLEISIRLQDIMQRRVKAADVSSEENIGGRSTLASVVTSDNTASELTVNERTGRTFEFRSGSAEAGLNGTNKAEKFESSAPSELTKEEINSAVVIVEDPQTIGKEGLQAEAISEENAIARKLAGELSDSQEDPGEAAENRLSISTRVAPVFYDNMSSGNAVATGMAGSEASGEVSISYGVNLAYQISDRIKLRSGISKLDLSFNTPGVPMAAVMNTGSFLGKEDPKLVTKLVEGELRQQINFIEVPMEVEYRLLDSRIGLNLIAGGSTLFLNNNNVSLDTGVRTTDLGQAENLEKLNFSANLGLGLDYELRPNFHLNLEPMFKYQLNSFSEKTGMQPYYLAIYSGFSISF